MTCQLSRLPVTDSLTLVHHPSSRHREYTNFLTEWGMFRYKRMPMGDHLSMDAYNYRFAKVTVGGEQEEMC